MPFPKRPPRALPIRSSGLLGRLLRAGMRSTGVVIMPLRYPWLLPPHSPRIAVRCDRPVRVGAFAHLVLSARRGGAAFALLLPLPELVGKPLHGHLIVSWVQHQARPRRFVNLMVPLHAAPAFASRDKRKDGAQCLPYAKVSRFTVSGRDGIIIIIDWGPFGARAFAALSRISGRELRSATHMCSKKAAAWM